MTRSVIVASLGVLAILIGGCGGPTVKVATITGTVSLDGKPVTGGYVSFTLPDGMPHTFEIQADGKYQADGVPMGEAVVTVTSPPVNDKARQLHIKQPLEQPAPAPSGPKFPEKYADMASSDLRYTVKPSDNKFDVTMKR